MSDTPQFLTVLEIMRANRRAGGHWFDRGAMEFFGTELNYRGPVYGGRWFIALHRPPHGDAIYGIHRADIDAHVETVGLEVLTVDSFARDDVARVVARWFERFDPVDALQDAAATIAARVVRESPRDDIDETLTDMVGRIVGEATARRNPYGRGTVADLIGGQLQDRTGRPTTAAEWVEWRGRLEALAVAVIARDDVTVDPDDVDAYERGAGL